MKNKISQKTVIIILAVLFVLALIFACVQLSRSSALRTQLREAEETLASKNADLTAASDELESAKASLSEASTRHEESAGALSEKEAELTKAQDELESAKTELENTKTELENAKTELESTKAELESAIASLSTSSAESAETAGAQGEQEHALAEAKAELDSAVAELETLNLKLQETEEALSAKSDELEAVNAELAALNLKLQETQEALHAKESELEAAKTEHQATADALAETEKTLEETEKALAEATAVHVHTWGAWETDIMPGCEAEGREIRRCETEPSDEETRLIPALGHDWLPATFTQPRHCARCGEISGTSAPESTYPTMEEVSAMSRDGAHVRISNTDKTPLQLPAESSYLSEPYRAKLSNNIYLMPIPALGHGHLGIVNEGTEVVVVAKRNGYVFFVTYDGRMGWNGYQLVG